MGQAKAGSLLETSQDLLPGFLEILRLPFRNHLLHVFLHFFLHSVVVLFVFKVLPVTNQEFHGLKRLHVSDFLCLGLCVIGAFHCQSGILRKEGELLQIVFLDSLVYVVDLIRTQECAQTENRSGQGHGGFVVEHSLRIHNENGQVFVSLFDKVRMAPHPDPGRVSLAATSPMKGIVFDGVDLFEPLLVSLDEPPNAAHLFQFSEVGQEPGQEKGLSGSKGSHYTNHGDFPTGRDLSHDGI
mmetsp:Transcript_18350/g.42122  ORF Transcript_18350/g.42122 Transcript_18350/m.42122 type:complete len:241 (-) Transcript_18350:440-1162(-)